MIEKYIKFKMLLEMFGFAISVILLIILLIWLVVIGLKEKKGK